MRPDLARSINGLGRWLPAAAAALSLTLGTGVPAAQAQVAPAAAAMAGSYQNFDVLNNTGEPAEGFEMEVYGVSSSQLTRIFPSNFNAGVIRYGFGTATDFPGGVRVRWAATYNAATGTWSTSTPVPPSLTTVPGDSCWTIGMPGTYQTAGCEHFGISATANPTSINYHWLVADPANPGGLVPGAPVYLAAPTWTVQPPANPALPPVVAAEVPAPPPPPARFGDAEWVKVYKVEQQAKVDAVDQLVGDNHAVVPEDAAELETNWTLLQADPPGAGGNQKRKGKLANQGNLGNGNHAVVRRYEYYKYAGAYDPLTHEALCADGTCTAPSPGEVGDAIGAQNAAANLNVNALTVILGGPGSVFSSDKVLSCGSKCYGVYNPGTAVTLTAQPSSGSVFTGWGGACSGNATTCTVTMSAESSVTASFAKLYTLSIGRSNPGTVTSSPAGVDCGGTCSPKFAGGTVVTLTATPPQGQSFVGWSGACTGADPSCTVTINADTKVQAAFSK